MVNLWVISSKNAIALVLVCNEYQLTLFNEAVMLGNAALLNVIPYRFNIYVTKQLSSHNFDYYHLHNLSIEYSFASTGL
jgi:hypothetical protein